MRESIDLLVLGQQERNELEMSTLEQASLLFVTVFSQIKEAVAEALQKSAQKDMLELNKQLSLLQLQQRLLEIQYQGWNVQSQKLEVLLAFLLEEKDNIEQNRKRARH